MDDFLNGEGLKAIAKSIGDLAKAMEKIGEAMKTLAPAPIEWQTDVLRKIRNQNDKAASRFPDGGDAA